VDGNFIFSRCRTLSIKKILVYLTHPHVEAWNFRPEHKALLESRIPGLKVDGGLGPKTIGSLKNVELERVRAYRIKYYADLVTRKPDLEKFYFGWFRRGLEV